MHSRDIIEDLAVMVQKGFQDAKTELGNFRKEVNGRFDRIENLILAGHKQRIERLEAEVKELRDLFGMK